MKKSLVDILICPTCKGNLNLGITEQTDDDILTGHLTCTECDEFYPIDNSIPNFLPKKLRDTV